MTKITQTTQEMPAPPAPDPEETEEQAAREKLEAMVRRAERGDASVMPGLRAVLDLAPAVGSATASWGRGSKRSG